MNRTTSYSYAKSYIRLASIAIVIFALLMAWAIVMLLVRHDDMDNVVWICLVVIAYAALWIIGAVGVRRMRTWGLWLVCALALLNLVAVGIAFNRLAFIQRLIALPYLYMVIEGAILLVRTPNASRLRELQLYSSHPDLDAYVRSGDVSSIARVLASGGLERKLAAIDALRAMGPAAASAAPQLSTIVHRSLHAARVGARFCEVCGKSLSAFSRVGSMCVRCSSELQVLKSINAWGRAPSLSQQAAAALAAIEARAQPVSIELHDASAGKKPRLTSATSKAVKSTETVSATNKFMHLAGKEHSAAASPQNDSYDLAFPHLQRPQQGS